jgi:hypothetical protein
VERRSRRERSPIGSANGWMHPARLPVLRTVAETRRERGLVLFATGFLTLLVGWMGLGWWLGRPGEPVDRALGVELPPGSRQVHAEHADVNPDAPFTAVYVTSAWTVAEAVERFEALAVEHHESARRFVLPDGTVVVVARPDDVPATRLSPIHPVRDDVPLGTRSWIVISRGTPPAATWSAAVPPNLAES